MSNMAEAHKDGRVSIYICKSHINLFVLSIFADKVERSQSQIKKVYA